MHASLSSREGVTPDGREIWIKRDDLNAPICGGNKVRSLEFLLGGLREGDTVFTVGGAGSTHVLCTAIHAARIGVRLDARRWAHDMNPVANTVSARVTTIVGRPAGWSAPAAIVRASWQASRARSRFIPIGGSTPLGALGHVNQHWSLLSRYKVATSRSRSDWLFRLAAVEPLPGYCLVPQLQAFR